MVNEQNQRNFPRVYGTRITELYASDFLVGQEFVARLSPDQPFHKIYQYASGYVKASGAVAGLVAEATLEFFLEGNLVCETHLHIIANSSNPAGHNHWEFNYFQTSTNGSIGADSIVWHPNGMIGRFPSCAFPLYAKADTCKLTIQETSLSSFATNGTHLLFLIKSSPLPLPT